MNRDYDYIVVGAGSAGAVVAARLSEDPDVTVLLVEAGGGDRHPLLRMPIAWPLAARDKRFGWGYESETEPELEGRRLLLPRGKVLGGSSAINGMRYSRGHPRDYDRWRQMGLEGWSYDDVLPYFRRSERSWRGAGPYHGGDGALEVREGTVPQLLPAPLAAAAKAAGHRIADDIHAEDTEGLSATELTVDRFGRRHSTARAFLRPARRRRNLTVLTHALTTRLVLENGRAAGIEYRRDGKIQGVRARREVVLSAGAYNTPQLLMLSGIGPADELRRHGIAVAADLPGVGGNLMEHPLVPLVMAAARPVTFLRQLRIDRAAFWALRWAAGFGGPFAVSGNTAGLFARSRPELDQPDLQLICATLRADSRLWWPIAGPGQPYVFSCGVSLIQPFSRGRLTLRSADPADKPAIRLGLFSDRRDFDTALAGLRMARALYAQAPLAELIEHELLPGAEAEDDAALIAHVRRMAATTQHPAGTCRMGTDPDAVTDAQLRVHGVDGLRIADASVMPTIPGGNINAPVIMIGEKAADLIRAPS